jgi:DNA-directed RNA polymerase specialized sigma24 family protein
MPNPLNQENIPRLPVRRDNAEHFFTYLIVDNCNGSPVIQWQNQAHLKRNFELYKERNEELLHLCSQPNKSQSIAEFWRQIAIDNPSLIAQEWEPKNRKILALKHLASYFEKQSYYAARTVSSKSNDLPWEEYLCCARTFIYNFDALLRLLRSYNLSHQTSIDTYIQQSLIKVIKSEADIGKFSPWRLLTKKSDKELLEALLRAGYQEPDISRFIFARKYFKQVYRLNKLNNPTIRQTGKRWSEPDSKDFQAAAECYNAEKYLSSAPHEVSAGLNINGKQMQAWMKICIDVLQKYPKSINLIFMEEIKQQGEETEEQDGEELLDESKLKEINLEAEELDSEENPLLYETKSAFQRELDRLKPEQHKILLLYYGADFNQKQIEMKLQVSQSAISRRLNTIKKQLLKTLIQKSHPHQWVTNYVVKWLHKNFRAPQHSELGEAALVQATKELSYLEQQVLFLRYGQKVHEEKIGNQLGMSLLEVNTKISESQYKLQSHLIEQISDWEKQYVEKRLKNFYRSKLSEACQIPYLSLDREYLNQNIDRIVEECLHNLIVTNK